MMRRRLTLGSTLLAAAIPACTHCSNGNSGPDSGALDGGVDAVSDRVALDQQAIDGGCTLESRQSDWPGWRRLTELDSCCEVDVPLDIKAAIPAFDWKPCQNGRPNCMQVDNVKYNSRGAGELRNVMPSRVGDQIALGIEVEVTSDPVTVTTEWRVVDRVSGVAVGAWRSRTSPDSDCLVGPNFGISTATLLGSIAIPNSIKFFLATDTPATLTSTPKFYFLTEALNPFEIPEGMSVSDTTIVYDQQTRGRFVRTKPNTSTYVLTTTPPQLVNPYVHKDSAFGRDQRGNAGWSQYWRVNPDAALTLFRAKANTHITALTSDLDTLYWAESWGGNNVDPNDQPHVEIWTAPFTDDPTTLAMTAKMLAKLDGIRRPGEMMAQSGFVGLQSSNSTAYIVRKSDGAVTTIAPYVNGESVGVPAYVSQTEVLVPVHLAMDPANVLMKITLGNW
jgi:hypothetical protein